MERRIYYKITKKIIIYSIILSMLIVNFAFTNKANATVEEGKFVSSELPYNIQFVKVRTRQVSDTEKYPHFYTGSTTIMLDTEGYLWEVNKDKGINKLAIDKEFKDFDLGFNHIIAIDKNDHIWAWGNNTYGQLGNGTQDDSLATPVEVLPTKKFKKVYCAESTSYAIDENDYLYAWGSNKFGEALGSNETIEEKTGTRGYQGINGWQTYNTYNYIKVQTIPIKILESTRFEKLSISNCGILALDKSGNVWGWGCNESGSIGIHPGEIEIEYNTATVDTNGSISWREEKIFTYVEEPIKIFDENTYKDISKGKTHSILLDTQGKVYTVGGNTTGALGNGSLTNSENLCEPIGLEEIQIKDIATSELSSFFIDIDNNIWACGNNSYGELGNGATANTATIVRVKNNEDNKFIEFPSDNYEGKRIYVFDKNNDLWGWGINTGNGIGAGISNTDKITTPIQITGKKTEYTVIFMNGTQTVDTQIVQEGASATAPTLNRAGYTYIWDTDFSNVTEDLTVRAIWTANTDTPYKIEHYLRTIDTEVEGYEKEIEEKQGATDSTAVATPKTYKGFTENTTHKDRVATGTITADGNLVLKLYYDRNTYNITYELNGGTPSGTLANSYLYGKETNLSNKVTKPGYNFAGWYDNSEFTGNPVTSIEAGEIGNKTFYAKWTVNQYEVTFIDRGTTVKTEIVNEGSSAKAPTLNREGYTYTWDTDFSNVQTNLTVTAVWTINKYKVTFKDGETEEEQQVEHGSRPTLPDWTKPGYDLSWEPTIENITEDTTITAVWTPRQDTPYKVEHYLRTTDTEVEGYEKEIEEKQGATDSTAVATPKTYKGFTENTTHKDRVATGTITADGNLVLKLYYDRNTYNITYELNGGTTSGILTNSYIYGKETNLSNKVTKPGYNFAGWYDNSEFTGSPVTSISKEEAEDKIFYAKWVSEELYYITSEKYNINEEENYITKVSPNTNVTDFINNITTNGSKKLVNQNGEEVTGSTLVGTGYKLQVTYKGRTYEYEIAVRGDLDGNGKITITDLSILNQILVKKLTVTGIREKAADLDYSGKISITDLSMMNQALTRRITL